MAEVEVPRPPSADSALSLVPRPPPGSPLVGHRRKFPPSFLAALRSLHLDKDLVDLQRNLQQVQNGHACNTALRLAAKNDLERLKLERQAQATLELRRHEEAARIQRLWRSYFVRKNVVPLKQACKEANTLAVYRQRLGEDLQCMREVVHDLTFLDEDRRAACVQIQRRWRGIFARRIVHFIRVIRTVEAVRQRMIAAAVKLQNKRRSQVARRKVEMLIRAKEQAMLALKQAKDDQRDKAATFIQASARTFLAARLEQRKRTQKMKALQDVEANAKGDSASNQRRKKKVNTKGGQQASSLRPQRKHQTAADKPAQASSVATVSAGPATGQSLSQAKTSASL
eukprot:TRINITY_DN122274_c0_g1_i1.p1 TRINITY_DN122274_c0_g1~~TRINITY_DN122274_c0_g1_i1.p1  ORF type:complete len:375 (+),score=117.36 TRINITY_DN122274_c0_g1_i1:105-1127(+)